MPKNGINNMNMIIGEGVIFNRFIDYSLQSKYFIIAGAVNESTINDEAKIFEEESSIATALTEHADSTIIYFSSCRILDSDVQQTQYVRHKLRMEKLIQRSATHYFIFRLPQVMGLSDAKNGFISYFVNAVVNHEKLEIHEIVNEILRQDILINKIINIASPRQTDILQLVRDIEAFTGCTADCKLVNKGSEYHIDISDIQSILVDLKLDFGKNYLRSSLRKYFQHLISAPKRLSIIVPTYNEEQGIEEFYRRTKYVLERLRPRFEYEFIFVNDCSSDRTLAVLESIALKDGAVKLIDFSRNFGNQIAITAGIDYHCGDAAIIIDDDLQDPPEIILNLIAKWDKGYKVVYGVRPKRQGVNPFFNFTARWYYRVIGNLSDINIPADTGDFRLIDRVVLNSLKAIREESRYYRGLVSWVGFPQVGVVYHRDKRFAGVSTFSFRKYVNFAINGLTSFTEKPLFFSSLAGLVITMVSFVLALILIANKIIDPSFSIQGWTSLVVVALFFGGIQLFSIGILGVYIGKIYRQVKGRPLYIVASTKNIGDQSDAYR
jgi:polyisoprenyl-phosphate glycosyltransferase